MAINIDKREIIDTPKHKYYGCHASYACDKFKVGGAWGYGNSQLEADNNAIIAVIESSVYPSERPWLDEGIRIRIKNVLKDISDSNLNIDSELNVEISFLLKILSHQPTIENT